MKIIINRCFGGFSVSNAAALKCRELGADWAQWPSSVLKDEKYPDDSRVSPFDNVWNDGARTCPHMIALVEEDSEFASGSCANLVVVEIPDDTEYEISEYDGQERIGPPIEYWD